MVLHRSRPRRCRPRPETVPCPRSKASLDKSNRDPGRSPSSTAGPAPGERRGSWLCRRALMRPVDAVPDTTGGTEANSRVRDAAATITATRHTSKSPGCSATGSSNAATASPPGPNTGAATAHSPTLSSERTTASRLRRVPSSARCSLGRVSIVNRVYAVKERETEATTSRDAKARSAFPAAVACGGKTTAEFTDVTMPVPTRFSQYVIPPSRRKPIRARRSVMFARSRRTRQAHSSRAGFGGAPSPRRRNCQPGRNLLSKVRSRIPREWRSVRIRCVVETGNWVIAATSVSE